jgi:uncharacterized protein YyaL (SSP411 family)
MGASGRARAEDDTESEITWSRRIAVRWEADVAVIGGGIAGVAFGLATLINAQDLLLNAVQIVMVGDDPELWRAIQSVSVPTRVLNRVVAGAELPPGHPAQGKTSPGVYVCRGQACLPPISRAGDLVPTLQGLFLGF